MKNLTQYVAEVNLMNSLFGSPVIDLPNLTAESAEKLFEKIDCDLSPENISCDGEASPGRVRQRAKLLTGARAELEKLGFTQTSARYC
jgi:hypothetical protein